MAGEQVGDGGASGALAAVTATSSMSSNPGSMLRGSVPIKMAVGRLMPVAGLGVDGRNSAVLGHSFGDAELAVVALFYVLAGHQGQQLGGVARRGRQLGAVEGGQGREGVVDQFVDQGLPAARSSQSQGGLPGPCGLLVAPRNYHALTTTFLTEAERRGQPLLVAGSQ